MPRHYLDHASASPPRPSAITASAAALHDLVGDPGRLHAEGMTTRAHLEHAREQVATLLGAKPREVVLTSGATEAIAAVCWGAAHRGGGHQVLTAVEHSAVRQAADRHGPVTVVGVDGLGRVDPDRLLAAVTDETSIVHVQWANHEVGTRQPVEAVVAACRARKVLVHVDAAQGVGRDPIDFASLDADLLSFSGPKFGAPWGTGGLLVRRGVRLDPLLVGGDQERARRAGLENVAGHIGLGAAAAELSHGALTPERAACLDLTDRLIAGLSLLDGVTVYGDPDHRAPHLVCVGISGIEPQAVLLGLDAAGIAAHSGSACATESLEPSPVLEAMGVDAHRSLRLSVGWSSTQDDVDAVLATLPDVMGRLRALA